MFGNLAFLSYVYYLEYWRLKNKSSILFQIEVFAIPLIFLMLPCFFVMYKQYIVFTKTAANMPKPEKEEAASFINFD